MNTNGSQARYVRVSALLHYPSLPKIKDSFFCQNTTKTPLMFEAI